MVTFGKCNTLNKINFFKNKHADHKSLNESVHLGTTLNVKAPHDLLSRVSADSNHWSVDSFNS